MSRAAIEAVLPAELCSRLRACTGRLRADSTGSFRAARSGQPMSAQGRQQVFPELITLP